MGPESKRGGVAGDVSGQTKQWDHQCNKKNVFFFSTALSDVHAIAKQACNCTGAQHVCAVGFSDKEQSKAVSEMFVAV